MKVFRAKDFFIHHMMDLWSSLLQVGVNIKNTSRFKKDETIWRRELVEPPEGC